MAHLGSVDDDADSGGSYIDEFSFLNDGAAAKCLYGELHEQHKEATGRVVSKSWVLFNNQSTVDVFCSKSLLRDIREAPNTCMISCNAGVVEVKMIGDLPGYPAHVWYYRRDGIASILFLYRVKQHCHVQYDSEEVRAAFHVTKPDGSVHDFRPSVSGLHYCETREDEDDLYDENYVYGSDACGRGRSSRRKLFSWIRQR
jgi:hypothetical protein